VVSLPSDIGKFDCAIANPPFGNKKSDGKAPRYSGRHFEYKVIDVASDLARYGVFILPQNLAPLAMSEQRSMQEIHSESYEKVKAVMGIKLELNCGIDTAVHKDDWHGISILTEIVLADFARLRQAREDSAEEVGEVQGKLFPAAA
jgi:hypothetical protein